MEWNLCIDSFPVLAWCHILKTFELPVEITKVFEAASESYFNNVMFFACQHFTGISYSNGI
jgi:hypothetical protein